MPPSGQLEKHGENQRKQKKTISNFPKESGTKENPTTKTRERENVFSCFCSVYFPLVSEKSSCLFF